jgi:hypothetical protein
MQAGRRKDLRAGVALFSTSTGGPDASAARVATLFQTRREFFDNYMMQENSSVGLGRVWSGMVGLIEGEMLYTNGVHVPYTAELEKGHTGNKWRLVRIEFHAR